VLKQLLVVLAVIEAAACGGGTNSTTAPTPTQASVTISVQPSPVTAVRCNPLCVGASGATFPFSATWTITLQESAGIGGNINAITITPSSGTGTLPPLTYGSDVVIQRSGTNHVGARGSLSFPMTLVYFTTAGSANLVINISVQFTDDRGNQLIVPGQVAVI